MTNEEIQKIKEQINALPQGGITYKTISGNRYAYYQWREEGKQRARRIKDEELAAFLPLIEKRKKLEQLLQENGVSIGRKRSGGGRRKAKVEISPLPAATLPQTEADHSGQNPPDVAQQQTVAETQSSAPAAEPFVKPDVAQQQTVAETQSPAPSVAVQSYLGSDTHSPVMPTASNGEAHIYKNLIRTGALLKQFALQIRHLPKRACYHELDEYLKGSFDDRILVLFGLRRTGKTVLIRQAILDMDESMLLQCAFIQPGIDSTFEELVEDLKYLEKAGFRYIFIDEITAIKGFSEKAAILADVFAAGGMKIVLSGADTLCFTFASSDQLYDRCIFLHTTFLPYREFSAMTGDPALDSYVRYGGTMIMHPGADRAAPFHSAEGTENYIQSAVLKNIQQAFRAADGFTGFSGLEELYSQGRLAEFIRNEIDEMNYVFAMVVITRKFLVEQTYVRPGNQSIRKPESDPEMVQVVKNLRDLYDHTFGKKRDMMNVFMYREEARKCLEKMDVIRDIDVVDSADFNKKIVRTVFTQPGLRYSQAENLFRLLLEDNRFRDLSYQKREIILKKLMGAVKEQMLKDALLLETAMARPEEKVFVLRFPDGDFDMAAVNNTKHTAEIYAFDFHEAGILNEFIYSEEKISLFENRYGHITGKYVIRKDQVAQYLRSPFYWEEETYDDVDITFVDAF